MANKSPTPPPSTPQSTSATDWSTPLKAILPRLSNHDQLAEITAIEPATLVTESNLAIKSIFVRLKVTEEKEPDPHMGRSGRVYSSLTEKEVSRLACLDVSLRRATDLVCLSSVFSNLDP
ncbi:hypothetical protein FOPE_12655 [Fonsecaea pedrosoi]|nr:hypothetical protein FOPE_12655 [Fonsecaea pedrosoi]